VGLPPIYYIIDSDYLIQQDGMENVDIANTDGGNGDPCHYDITNSNRKDADNFAKNNFKIPNLIKCNNGHSSPITIDELELHKGNALKALGA